MLWSGHRHGSDNRVSAEVFVDDQILFLAEGLAEQEATWRGSGLNGDCRPPGAERVMNATGILSLPGAARLPLRARELGSRALRSLKFGRDECVLLPPESWPELLALPSGPLKSPFSRFRVMCGSSHCDQRALMPPIKLSIASPLPGPAAKPPSMSHTPWKSQSLGLF